MKSLFFFIFSFLIHHFAYAESADQVFQKDSLWRLTPPGVNDNYLGLEIGFLTKKEIKFVQLPYNAFASGVLVHNKYEQDRNLKTAALGFKGGVFLPTNPWIPILMQFNVGYAKTTFQQDPWFGRNIQAIKRADMLLFDVGPVFRYDRYFLSAIYEFHNIKTIENHFLISIGGNFR
jgi:hypothetical protein